MSKEIRSDHNWDVVDWSHLSSKERKHVRTMLARRAYLVGQVARHEGRRSYALDEVLAIDWALGLAVDRGGTA